MNIYYAGIGSRNTPEVVLNSMIEIGTILAKKGYILRSGGAIGADRAFEEGCNRVNGKKEIFLTTDQIWAYNLAKSLMPPDRHGFDGWKTYTKGLLARNMMQIMGKDSKSLVEFVICWAPSIEYWKDSSSGGTGYAIRCALNCRIPVYNMYDNKDLEVFIEKYMNQE